MNQQKGLSPATECHDLAYNWVRSSKAKIEDQRRLNEQAFANRLHIDKYRHIIKVKEAYIS